MNLWVIPYIDQPPAFWEEISGRFAGDIREVYFSLPGEGIASARGPQPDVHLPVFLQSAPLPKAALVNPILFHRPVEEISPAVVSALRRVNGEYGVDRVTVASLALARIVREALPAFRIAASTLMGLASPIQAIMAQDCIDVLVPDTRIVRDLTALRRLREAFPGELRLLINEACLPGCPYRVQHFYEMSYGDGFPPSLCRDTLEWHPWMRLTGAWVLPRHLGRYDGLYDSLKLAGRVTLRDPVRYRRVLEAYIRRLPILPRDIGGGPASVLDNRDMPDALFDRLLACGKQCHVCSACREYYESGKIPDGNPPRPNNPPSD